jgi:hypothetical protein
MNQTAGFTKEAIDEFRHHRHQRETYIGPDGKFIKSAAVDNVSLVLKLITGVRDGH